MKLRKIFDAIDKLQTMAQKEASTIALSTALTGVRFHPDRLKSLDGRPQEVPNGHLAENMPITAFEIGRDARAAADEGSTFFHIHARNPATGRQSASPTDYAAAVREIKRQVPGALVSGPTSRKEEAGAAIDQRMSELYLIDKEYNPEAVAQAEMGRAFPAILGGV